MPDQASIRERLGSRSTAAVIALVVTIAPLLLFSGSLRPSPPIESPAVQPLLVYFFDQPRGQHQQSHKMAIRPRLTKVTLRPPDTPPSVVIDVPVEVPPSPVPSTMSAGLPPGHKNVAGDGSPRGNTEGPGEGAGPGVIHQVASVYPVASLRAHEQGIVALRVLVNSQGVPSQVRLARSSGFPRLDQSATEAVRHYRFSPPARQAPAGGSWTTVNVEFDLLRMPVPTTVMRYDLSLAEQIAVARHSSPGFRLDILNMTPRVKKLASHLLDSLLQRGAEEPATPHPGAAPTPIQQLTTRGKLQWVRFVGFANRGFDCGTITAARDPPDARCEIFEVQQASGISYWLALVGDGGTQLENLAVTTVQPLRVANLTSENPARADSSGR